MRILFVTDPHSADIILKKSIRIIDKFNIDLFILSGDLSGKDLHPVIKVGLNEYKLSFESRVQIVDKNELYIIENKYSDYGHYYFHCTESEYEEMSYDANTFEKVLNSKIVEKLESWIDFLIDSPIFSKTQLLISPGNDDFLEIDKILKFYTNKEFLLDNFGISEINNTEIISFDYTTPTPWRTFRELNEKSLENQITKKLSLLRNPKNSIFNFHCPPINTKIDLAPKLDKNLKPVIIPGIDNLVHAGSNAVRKIIQQYQPLLGLHGHFHDSAGIDFIGSTVCLNPGSEYEKGILRGFVIEIDIMGNLISHTRIEA